MRQGARQVPRLLFSRLDRWGRCSSEYGESMKGLVRAFTAISTFRTLNSQFTIRIRQIQSPVPATLTSFIRSQTSRAMPKRKPQRKNPWLNDRDWPTRTADCDRLVASVTSAGNRLDTWVSRVHTVLPRFSECQPVHEALGSHLTNDGAHRLEISETGFTRGVLCWFDSFKVSDGLSSKESDSVAVMFDQSSREYATNHEKLTRFGLATIGLETAKHSKDLDPKDTGTGESTH